MARKLPIAVALLALVAVLFAGSAQARRLSTLVAPPSACPHQTDLGDSPAVQERAMLCLTDYARRHDGLGRLGDAADLDRSAGKKSGDIIRCDNFSHEACGRRFTYWMQRSGYLAARCWRAGENIAWGTGSYATVRSIFLAWLHSPEHRANLLGRYSSIGIALRIGGLEGHREAHVWTQDFGSHCGAPRRHRTPHIPVPHIGLRTAFRAR
ncbi:MAG TPA: CAP domain-containing protein [Solirubrobacterales bacterium]|nr:CAP domain-containing protein [Solirubrobacterales bacterium]